MFKKLLLPVAALSLAGNAWALIGDPYIGEEAIGWQTTSAVTVTSSQDAGGFGGGLFTVGALVNGGAFEASGAPGSKLPFAGAPYTTDGWSHTSSPVDNTWISDDLTPKTSPSGIANSQVWVQFAFDKVYGVKDITVWNSGMDDEAALGRSWKDAKISWSADGSSWEHMDYTFSQKIVEGSYYFLAPTDPAIPFAHDAQYVVFSGLSNYGGGEYMMSEVRFNLVPEPSTVALLGLGAFGLLFLRRKN